MRVCDNQYILLFGNHVFNKRLHTVRSFEFAYEPRIPTTSYQTTGFGKPRHTPELASNSKVFTASHKSVAFACLRCSSNPRRVKIFLFSACNSHQSTRMLQTSLDRNCIAHLPRHTSAYSRLTILAETLVSLRGARPQPPGPNARFKIRRYLISGRYIRPSITQ